MQFSLRVTLLGSLCALVGTSFGVPFTSSTVCPPCPPITSSVPTTSIPAPTLTTPGPTSLTITFPNRGASTSSVLFCPCPA
ncbi:hypothetical protein SCHPADRAFT_906005 [Schizopora paradoxa]|uniref:Uncharacterized protein n=1 Tax=Schizopora paradoxa TaxID=27342 RepID=A0A0H2RPN8_9AGAM|nr:hypothetical protein SCHPADRAFT_906005 [Schizopora paradoxa]